MTPKQLTNAELLRYVLGQYGNIGADLSPGDPKVKELCNRFERLQAPLPEDLETWLQAMADKKVELTYGKAVAVLVPPPEYLKLTTTIRSLKAKLDESENQIVYERERGENNILAHATELKKLHASAEEIIEAARAAELESWLKAFMAHGFNAAFDGTYTDYVGLFLRSKQASLPEDLETWMAQIKEYLNDDERISDGTLERVVVKLIGTIRSMMAHIEQLEALRDKEGQENAIFAAAMGKKNSELQAELQKERERLSIAESYLKRSLQESTFLAYEKEAVASDKANTEEKP